MGLKDCFGLLEKEEWDIPSKKVLDGIIKELELKFIEAWKTTEYEQRPVPQSTLLKHITVFFMRNPDVCSMNHEKAASGQ